MKKNVMFLCGMMLGAALLTGCGGGTETEAPTQTEVVTEAVETEAAETEAVETEAVTEAAEEETAAASDFAEITSEVAGWTFTVEDVQRSASLENVSVELGYTGVETSDYVKEASEGMEFVLVKLKIEKGKSTEVVAWENFKMTDGNGNEYARISDEFLLDLGMMRMSGNDLNFGSNEGWVVFEVNADADNLGLKYPFAEETYTAELGSGK